MSINEGYIKQQIQENNVKLLGQIEITSAEYDELVYYAKLKTVNLYMPVIPAPDLLFSLTLVQVAIRCYKDGKFWPCFEEVLGIKVPSTKLNYIGRIFYKTITYYNMFSPRLDDGDFQYVEYIKAHAFVTDYYMQGFYDFSYAFFENNLFRQVAEDIEEDFEDLSFFMSTTLNNKNDKIVETDSKRASKSYRLLKSTRTAFAICDAETIRDIYLPILYLIDKFFYDDEIPQIPRNRFERGFIEWCAIQKTKESHKQEGVRKNRKIFSHKPFIQVDVDRELSFLVIPPQKFRLEDCNGEAKAIVEINGYTEDFDLEVYTSFGLYITEEKIIPIPSIFDAINITIKTFSEKKHHIPAAAYRIFNRTWENQNRFQIGHNYILVKLGVYTSWKDKQDMLDYSDGYKYWQYFSAIISENSVFYVGNKPLSIIGEFSYEPVFERKVEHFKAFDEEQKEITIAREHPIVAFVVEKDKINGSVLIVNGEKYPLEQIAEKVCYEWLDDKSKYAVNIALNNLLPNLDGEYQITLDVPSCSAKQLCKYLFLRKFDCRFNKPRYTYAKDAIFRITKGDCSINIKDEAWILDSETESTITYTIPLDKTIQDVELVLHICKQYTITMPIRVFLYGFSEMSMQSQWRDYIWYSELQENLYIKIPGAKAVWAYYGKNDTLKMQGTQIAESTFRIDISEFIRKIKENEKFTYHYINLVYEDNAIRRLSLPVIYRRMIIEPYFKVFTEGDIPYIDINIKGNSNVFLKVEDLSGNVVIDKMLIQNGKNTLPELSEDVIYNFYPYTEDIGKFGFNVQRSPLRPLENLRCINLNDLTSCELVVQALMFDEEVLPMNYEYHINLTEKINDTQYIGFLFGDKIEKILSNGRICYEKGAEGKRIRKKLGKVSVFVSRMENELHISLQTYSYQDEDWRSIYYDKTTKSLIHFDDSLLDSKGAEDRFLFLDEYDTDTTFIVDTKKIKSHKEC